MTEEQKLKALQQKIAGLTGAHIDKVSRFVHNMIAADAAAIVRTAVIRDLPRLIADYPILVWGWDPCHSNDIAEVWFGPTTAPVVNVRKNYPQHKNLDRYQSLAMLVSDSGGDEYTFAGDNLEAWMAGVQITGEELAEFAEWAEGPDWPSVYNADDKTLEPADLKRVNTEADYITENLAEMVCETAADQLRRIVSHIQSLLHASGTNLSSEHPEVGFSFNRENGTIDHLDGRKFIPLINRSIGAAPTGALVASGVSLAGQNLAGATLKGYCLEDMNMSNANLSNVDLRSSELECANFSGANLSGANLTNTYLPRSNFSGADLTGADLTGADLSKAVFTDVIFDETTTWPAGFSPPEQSA